MKIEVPLRPSPEQLTILQRPPRAIEIIKGAAGSGKTLTALYKLIFAMSYISGNKEQLNIQILSYNKTLKGYIEEMMQSKNFPSFPQNTKYNISINTFSKWAMNICNIHNFESTNIIYFLEQNLGNISFKNIYTKDFIAQEMEYILKRFPHDNFELYVSAKRNGRGTYPPVSREMRKILLEEYVIPYFQWKEKKSLLDWEDIAWQASVKIQKKYDIFVVDEGQDFTANQYRAVVKSLTDASCLICVIDTAQKIYLNGFTWTECGMDIRKAASHTLRVNFRNTRQIAALAAAMLSGVEIDDNGVIPQFHSSMQDGEVPLLLVGKFTQQMDYIVEKILQYTSKNESSAVMLKCDRWTGEIKRRLTGAGLEYASITREDSWPGACINVVISTMHSVKGIEFDHVFMPGINNTFFPDYGDTGLEAEQQDRRLLAMAIGRAKKTVTLGEKPTEESPYFKNIDDRILQRVRV